MAHKSKGRPKPIADLPPGLPLLLTKAQVCAWAQCSPKFLEGEINAGRLRVHRISQKLLRFTQADVLRWLESNKT